MRTVFWAIVLMNIPYIAYSSITLRGLYADGANYLVSILRSDGFALWEPSRLAVHVMQQTPTVLLWWIGVDDIPFLAGVYTATMLTVPLLLLLACYSVLPIGAKAFVLFPLYVYLAGALGTLFAAIGEGSIAAMYFWLVLLMVLFYATTRRRRLVTALVALPVPLLAEVLAFLAPLLAAAAGIRLKRAVEPADRRLSWFLILYFVATSLWQIKLIVAPMRGPLAGQRDNMIEVLLALKFLINGSQVNVPAVLGVVAGLFLAIIFWRASRADGPGQGSAEHWMIAVLSLLAIGGIVGPFLTDNLMSTKRAFQARYYPGFLSFPVALALLATLYRPRLGTALTSVPTLTIVGILGLGTLGWHAVATWHWDRFLTDFRRVLTAPCHGLIAHADMMAALPKADARNVKTVSTPWTNPLLSVLLSPQGRVTTIIDSRQDDYRPLEPQDTSSLPAIRGIDFSGYLTARRQQKTLPAEAGRTFPCVKP